jgi:hypothetical protein
MKFNISISHFEQLIKQSYSLDHIFLLKLIESNIDMQSLTEGSMKISGLYQSLVRKGLVSDVTQSITILGRELLAFSESTSDKPIKKVKAKSSDFDDWWNAFPPTDNFVHNGKKFTGSRGLKRSRDECRVKFNKILAEGEYTALDLLNSMLLDVNLKKESSCKFGENRLSYLQNSLTYLNQRSYEPFIEMLKSDNVQIIESSNNKSGTDI